MAETRSAYGVGEVIYPRQGLPPCADCHDPSELHRYTVVSDRQMAPSGCDGDSVSPCPCARYVAPEGTPLPAGAKPPPSREETWAQYPHDAFELLEPRDSPRTRCAQALCQAPIWWGLTAANHKRCPFDIRPDGTRTQTSHWRTCRDRPVRGGRST